MRLPAAPSAALLVHVLLAARAATASASAACTTPSASWARPEKMVVVLAPNNKYYSWKECKSLANAAAFTRASGVVSCAVMVSWSQCRDAATHKNANLISLPGGGASEDAPGSCVAWRG